MKTSMINENRFFKQVAPYLFSKNKIIEEMIENAQRANAKTIKITTNENSISFFNDGNVLNDFENLFMVAQSCYDKKVENEQKPAGMGILSILGNANEVVFSSGYQTIKVNCEEYFNNDKYRLSLLNNITTSEQYLDGFKIEAIVENAKKILNSKFSDFEYYDINIIVNDKEIAKREISFFFEKEITKGVKLVIPKSKINSSEPFDSFTSSYVLWHGKKIRSSGLEPFSIIVNGETNLITPKLPDRNELIQNYKELQKLVFDFEKENFDDIQKCIKKITSYSKILNLVNILNESYDVEHLETFSGIKKNENKPIIKLENFSFKLNDEDYEDFLDIDNTQEQFCLNFDVFQPFRKLNTPSWLKERIITPKLQILQSEHASEANTYMLHRDNFQIVDTINLNGIELDAIYMSDTLYFTKDYDFFSFAHANAERYSWEYQEHGECEDEIIEDFESILAYYNQEICIDSKGIFFHAIKSLNNNVFPKGEAWTNSTKEIVIKKVEIKDAKHLSFEAHITLENGENKIFPFNF